MCFQEMLPATSHPATILPAASQGRTMTLSHRDISACKVVKSTHLQRYYTPLHKGAKLTSVALNMQAKFTKLTSILAQGFFLICAVFSK